MVTGGSYTCEHSIMYELAESLCCTSETNVALCVNHNQKLKRKKKVDDFHGCDCTVFHNFEFGIL